MAAKLPADWQVKLVDLNVNRLTDDDLRWADYVMLGAMGLTVLFWFWWTRPIRRASGPLRPGTSATPPHATPEPPI